jgi:hypothetical protein
MLYDRAMNELKSTPIPVTKEEEVAIETKVEETSETAPESPRGEEGVVPSSPRAEVVKKKVKSAILTFFSLLELS